MLHGGLKTLQQEKEKDLVFLCKTCLNVLIMYKLHFIFFSLANSSFSPFLAPGNLKQFFSDAWIVI
jgi:hypothetical protein